MPVEVPAHQSITGEDLSWGGVFVGEMEVRGQSELEGEDGVMVVEFSLVIVNNYFGNC